jgi:hypothetical protein
MRLAGIALGALLVAAPAMAQFIDRDAVVARAREVATATLPGVASADLALFQIAYDLTLLETGNPAGRFEVVLLLRSSREVIPARDITSAAPDAEAAARLGLLLAGVDYGYHYRTVQVRFAERGGGAASAEFSTLLLNRDPETALSVVSSAQETDE